MATSPSGVGALQGIEQWLPLIESLAGAGLTIAGGYGVIPAGIAPLAAAVESALNPLFSAIASKTSTQTDILAGWAAAIGIWTAIGNQTGISDAVKERVTVYIAAGQQATAKYYLAQQGFDPTLYGPVTPIE